MTFVLAGVGVVQAVLLVGILVHLVRARKGGRL